MMSRVGSSEKIPDRTRRQLQFSFQLLNGKAFEFADESTTSSFQLSENDDRNGVSILTQIGGFRQLWLPISSPD